MVQISLVSEQIEAGRRLIETLLREGINVTAAGWLRTEDNSGRWYLYIATPIADDPLIAYRRVLALVRQMPEPSGIGPLEVKLISPESPRTKRMIELRESFPTKDILHFADSLGIDPAGIEEAFVYPVAELIASR